MSSKTVLAVSGTRTIKDWQVVCDRLDMTTDMLNIDKIICGDANGVDKLTEMWYHLTDRDLEYEEYEADWDKYGKSAGPIRNSQLIDDAHALLAIWDGKSTGTKDAMDKAVDSGMDVIHTDGDDGIYTYLMSY